MCGVDDPSCIMKIALVFTLPCACGLCVCVHINTYTHQVHVIRVFTPSRPRNTDARTHVHTEFVRPHHPPKTLDQWHYSHKPLAPARHLCLGPSRHVQGQWVDRVHERHLARERALAPCFVCMRQTCVCVCVCVCVMRVCVRACGWVGGWVRGWVSMDSLVSVPS